MNFLYPSFLFALSAIAIPILIHLFNFRKFKTIYFSNVRFLKEIKQETQKQSKLKHLLVLLCRILAITSLVFAFSQPFIPAKNKNITIGDKAVSIFIDNSFSMDAINKNGTLLDDAKKKALEIVSTYKATDRFQLLSNDFEGRHQRLVSKEEFSDLLDEIKISPATKNLSEIISRQNDVLKQSGYKNKNIFIISDLQKSISDFNKFTIDSSISINLIPIVANENNNVYIDTCWFESPVRKINQTEKLHVRIVNKSNKTLENNAIKLFINNEQKTPASFTVESNNSTEIVLSFSSKQTGIQHCKIEINDYPVTFDDKFYFCFDVAKNIPILCINNSATNNENSYLNNLFGKDSLFQYTNIQENKLDYSSFANYSLIILNELKTISSGLAQELNRFVINGGSLMILPSSEAEIASYNSFLQPLNTIIFERKDSINTIVDKINFEHPIYNDVFDSKNLKINNLDLPKINEHYALSKNSKSNSEYLLKLQNGDGLLNISDIEKGKIYTSAIGLNTEFSNFPKHALFVPTLIKIAINSLRSDKLFYTLGTDNSIEISNVKAGENVFAIKSLNNTYEFIPEHKSYNSKTEIHTRNQIAEAGNYNLINNQQIIEPLAFNNNRKESDLTCHTSETLQKELSENNLKNIQLFSPNEKPLNIVISEQEQGTKLWKICIILALLFLGAEIILLRLIKG